MCNAHDLSLYHHQVCDCRLTVYSVPICLCTIFHIPVAIHGPQTEYNKTGFFTWLPRFLSYVLQIIYLQRCVFAQHSTHHIRPLCTVRFYCRFHLRNSHSQYFLTHGSRKYKVWRWSVLKWQKGHRMFRGHRTPVVCFRGWNAEGADTPDSLPTSVGNWPSVQRRAI